jgi:large subunit ribosomal protein L16
MLQPKFRAFRKINRQCFRTTYENKSCHLNFGTHGIQATESGCLTAQQIEAVRRTLTSRLKRKGKMWIRAYPDSTHTSKPKEVRMGRGKGNVDFWFCNVKSGRILFEVSINPKYSPLLTPAFHYAIEKLPIKAQVISRLYNLNS